MDKSHVDSQIKYHSDIPEPYSYGVFPICLVSLASCNPFQRMEYPSACWIWVMSYRFIVWIICNRFFPLFKTMNMLFEQINFSTTSLLGQEGLGRFFSKSQSSAWVETPRFIYLVFLSLQILILMGNSPFFRGLYL